MVLLLQKGFQTEVVGSSPISIDVISMGSSKHDFCRIRTVRSCDGRPGETALTPLGLPPQVMSDCNVRGSNLPRHGICSILPCPSISTVLRVCRGRGPSLTSHLPAWPPFFPSFFLCRGFFATPLPHAKSDQLLLSCCCCCPYPCVSAGLEKTPPTQHPTPSTFFFLPPSNRRARRQERQT